MNEQGGTLLTKGHQARVLARKQAAGAVAACALISLVFFWEPLVERSILLPTNPSSFEPWWSELPAGEREQLVSNVAMFDSLILTYPWRVYNHEQLRGGGIPFWNPWIFSGYPHLAALQSHALYPLQAIFDLLLDPASSIGFAMALHFVVAGVLMYLFLRRRLSFAAALLGGIAFELNGFFMVRMGAPSYVFTATWTPLLLIGVEDLMKGSGWRSAWKLSLGTCLAFLGGHPQILVLILCLAGLYTVALALCQIRSGSNLASTGRCAAAPLLAVVLGVGLSGLQLVPFLELVTESARSEESYDSYLQSAAPSVALVQAVVPDIFGHHVDGSYWLERAAPVFRGRPPEEPRIWVWNYIGENLYTGVGVLLLAAIGIGRFGDWRTLFFSGVAVYSLLVFFGAPGVLWLTTSLLPTFHHSRADRILFLYVFAVCVLAAYGYESVAGRRSSAGGGDRTWANVSTLVVSVPLAAMVLGSVLLPDQRQKLAAFSTLARSQWNRSSVPLQTQIIEAATVAIALVLALFLLRRLRTRAWVHGIVVLLAAIPMFKFGWRFNPVQERPLFRDSPTIERLVEEVSPLGRVARLSGNWRRALPPNTAQLFGIFDIHGASAAALARYSAIIEAADSGALRKSKYFHDFRWKRALLSPLINLLGVEVAFSHSELPPPWEEVVGGDSEDSRGGPRLYRNRDSLPRFFLVREVSCFDSTSAALLWLLDDEFDPRREAVIDAEENPELCRAGQPLGEARDPEAVEEETVTVSRYRPQEVELELQTASEALLVSSEVDYPGWVVFVDGSPAPKVLVNTAFRGVVVPPGTHEVTFRFVPKSFRLGVFVSLVSLATLLGSLLWLGREGRTAGRIPWNRPRQERT